MVQSALVISLVALWLGRMFSFPSEKEKKKYKIVLNHYNNNNNYASKKGAATMSGFGGKSHSISTNVGSGGKKNPKWYHKLPDVSAKTVYKLLRLVEFLAVIALYYYLNGNCQFDKYRMFAEDDEFEDSNYLKGFLVLSFSIVIYFLGEMWLILFFRMRKPLFAMITTLIILTFGTVLLWAMGSAEPCVRDTFANRFWLSFALWLIYMIYIIFLFFISTVWMRVVGWRINKKDDQYQQAVESHQSYKNEKHFSKHYNRWAAISAHAHNKKHNKTKNGNSGNINSSSNSTNKDTTRATINAGGQQQFYFEDVGASFLPNK